MKKKILALLLAFCVVVSMLPPIPAAASSTDLVENITQSVNNFSTGDVRSYTFTPSETAEYVFYIDFYLSDKSSINVVQTSDGAPVTPAADVSDIYYCSAYKYSLTAGVEYTISITNGETLADGSAMTFGGQYVGIRRADENIVDVTGSGTGDTVTDMNFAAGESKLFSFTPGETAEYGFAFENNNTNIDIQVRSNGGQNTGWIMDALLPSNDGGTYISQGRRTGEELDADTTYLVEVRANNNVSGVTMYVGKTQPATGIAFPSMKPEVNRGESRDFDVMTTNRFGLVPNDVVFESSDPDIISISSQDHHHVWVEFINPGTAKVICESASNDLYAEITFNVAGDTSEEEIEYDGTLTLSAAPISVTLKPGEEKIYAFEADAEVLYYYYKSQSGNVKIRPEMGHGTSLNYEDSTNGSVDGTLHVTPETRTVPVYLKNLDENNPVTLNEFGVTIPNGTPTSMELGVQDPANPAITMEVGNEMPFYAMFSPKFSYEKVSFELTSGDAVDLQPIELFGHATPNANLVAVKPGTAEIKVTAGSFTQTCTVTVNAPASTTVAQTGTNKAQLTGEDDILYSFTPTKAGRYVISANRVDEIELRTVTATDNFTAHFVENGADVNKQLIIFENIAENETVYFRVRNHTPNSGSFNFNVEAGTTAESFELRPSCDPVVPGQDFVVDVVYDKPSDYAPIPSENWSWTPSDALSQGANSNYASDFTCEKLVEGEITITATNAGNKTAEVKLTTSENVVGDEGGPEPNVNIDGNDGTFTWSMGNSGGSDIGGHGFNVTPGLTLESVGFSVTDIKFWNTERKFDKWMACTREKFYDDEGNEIGEGPVQISGTDLMTTEEMLDFKIPEDKNIIFMAQWAGSDDDYYTDIQFDSWMGELSWRHAGDSNTNNGPGFGTRFREDGNTIGDTIQLFDPVRNDNGTALEFEGWVKCKRVGENDALMLAEKDEDGSYIAYTTSAVMAHPVPEDHICYVAKWKELGIEEYVGGSATVKPVVIDETDSLFTVQSNDDGFAAVEFTAPENGYYMLAYEPEPMKDVVEITPSVTKVFDHDIMHEDRSFCGPVYNLTKDTTYTFLLKTHGGMELDVMMKPGVLSSDISASVTSITGYVGTRVTLHYEVDPVDSFSGVNTSTSNDPAVAVDSGGANADCTRDIQLLKAGKAEITVTLHNGKSVTVEVNAIEPPKLTLDQMTSVTLEPHEETVYAFNAVKDTLYYYYKTPGHEDVEIRPEVMPNISVSGSGTSYQYQDLNANGTLFRTTDDTTVYVILHNHSDEQKKFEVSVKKTDVTPTAMSLDRSIILTSMMDPPIPLQAMFAPAFSYEDVTFSIADKNVVGFEDEFTVTYVLKPVGVGETTITASTANFSDDCKVVVINNPVYMPGNIINGEMGVPGQVPATFIAEKDQTYFLGVSNSDVTLAFDSNFSGTQTPVTFEWNDRTWNGIEFTVPATDVYTASITNSTNGNVSFESVLLTPDMLSGDGDGDDACDCINHLEYVERKEATCEEDGWIACWLCLNCDTIYADKDAQNVIEEEDAILDKVSHKLTHHAADPATCEKAGTVEYWSCSGECGKNYADANGTTVLEKVTTEKANHTLTHTEAVAPTYTKGGNTEYYSCSVCGNFFADAAGLALIEDKTLVEIPALVQKVEDKEEDDKVESDTEKTEVKVEVTVTTEAADAAIEEAKKNAEEDQPLEVVLPIASDVEKEIEEKVEVISTELPVDVLTAVADEEAILTVELGTAVVTMDTAALEAISEQAEGQSVTLVVEEIPTEQLSEKQQKAVEKHNVVAVISAELICQQTGENIWTNKDNNARTGEITVRLPFTPEKGHKGNEYTIYFVDDNGSAPKKIKTVYDEVAKCLVFTLNHFSEYVISLGEVETTPEPSDEPTATPEPSDEPTATPEPSDEPTATPAPSDKPTATPAPSDKPTATPAPSDVPATGDNDALLYWSFALAVAAAGILLTSVKAFGRKRYEG